MRRASAYLSSSRLATSSLSSSTPAATAATVAAGSFLGITSTAQHRGFSHCTPRLAAAPGQPRSWLENFWEVHRRTNELSLKTGRPVGPTAVREIWADVRAVGNGMGPFPKPGEPGANSSSSSGSEGTTGGTTAEPSARAGVVGQPGPPMASFNLSILLLMITSIELWRRMMLRTTGNGDLDYPYSPMSVVSKVDRSKQTIANLLWTEQEKESFKAGFFAARQGRPTLGFWQYMDDVHPGWNSGHKVSGAQLTGAVMGACATQTEYQFVAMTNRLQHVVKSLSGTQAKADAIYDEIKTLHAGNPAMALAANMAGAQAGGGMPVMRMTQTPDGRMVMTDGSGNQIPVQSMQSLVQSGGLTMTPTGRVATGGQMPQGGPMILSGAPPGSTITSAPYTPKDAQPVVPDVPVGDHGTVPQFK